MKNNLMDAQDVFLNGINRICGKLGLNNIMAQLYSILYFSNKPLSLDDMVERLRISKASASINIRALERYGAVRQMWVKGSRKDFYEAEADITRVIIERTRSMAKGRLSEVERMMKSAYAALDSISGGTDEESVRAFKERLDKLNALYEKAQGFFELFNAGLLATMASSKTESAKEELSYEQHSVRGQKEIVFGNK